AKADHRLPLRASQVESFARAVAAGVGVAGVTAAAPPTEVPAEWLRALVADLTSHRGTSLVVAGLLQPPSVHALAHAINIALGNIGKTVTLTAPVEVQFGDPKTSLRTLVDDMNAGRVETLIVFGTNPVYSAPADIGFEAAMQSDKVPLRIHMGVYDDETGALCHWHLPQSHYLEAWSDARSFDGSVTIVQPLIQPLYATHSSHELISVLLGGEERGGYNIVREYWMGRDPRYTRPARQSAAGGKGGLATGSGAAVGGRSAAGSAAPTAGRGTTMIGREPSPEFERFWHQALLTGVVPGSASPARTVALAAGAVAAPTTAPAAPSGMEIVFRPDPTIWDGEFANNGWLEELPKPITKLTWDNAAMISPGTALQLGLVSKIGDYAGLSRANGQMVTLAYGGRQIEAAVRIVPGHPDNAVTLTLGYGRKRAGRIGTALGFNAYALRTAENPWFGTGLEVRKLGRSYELVSAQDHFSMEGRDLIRVGKLEQLARNPQSPDFMHATGHDQSSPPTLYTEEWPSDRKGVNSGQGQHGGGAHGPGDGPVTPETPTPAPGGASHDAGSVPHAPGATPPGAAAPHPKDPGVWRGGDMAKGVVPGEEVPAWGMVIDLNACIGCNACTVACQAENNIATVGKDQVGMNREMHWLRIDTYFQGDLTNPETVFQPLPCQHCEKAPCEPVCPVEATSHSAEGINEMTYNRCIGTRYCENNCPYKVRRFNYLQYSDHETPTIQMMRNPDVTVRARGVMEKCTYCVQRVNLGRMEAEKEDRAIRDGDVVTACQQVCPTRAIIFGNVNDTASHGGKGSRVRQLKQAPLDYTVLTELNTRPRTSYLAAMRNPNPAVPVVASGDEGGH
ncbi:MAG TPA: 4Fe-4S dicluster domain-containing protein, partial [Armatimonadota bacterium]|nr:4Fe-4S dicluster domain-containing protein [Armatimonadota bacterium]